MKKTIFTFIAIMFTALLMNAQSLYSISGYVTNLNGGAIANHTVYVWTDSLSSLPFSANAVTNSNGYYTLSITSIPASSTIMFHVGTIDCNGVLHTSNINVSSTNPQNIVNFSICSSTATSCQAAFTYTPGTVNTKEIHFQDASTGTPSTWTWNFGDGISGTGSAPIHTYSNPGNYIVCLTIYSSSGCTSTHCDTIHVTGTTTNSCHASFYMYQDSIVTIPNSFHFINTSTSSYSGASFYYHWSFGDGTTSTLASPTHAYTSVPPSGGYTVCYYMAVYVNNIIVCSDSTCLFVQLNNTTTTCQNSFTFTHQNLVYAFSGSINSSSPTTYHWTFGDGSASATGQNVTHTFPQPPAGTSGYHVCLITETTNSSGTTCHDTTCQFIQIGTTTNSCHAGFTFYLVNDSLLNNPHNYHFNNTSTSTYTGSTISYYWSFGDGITSTVTNPTHAYTSVPPAGGYTVCLHMLVYVNNIVVCSDSVCQFVQFSTTTNCQNSFTYTHQNLIYTFTGSINTSGTTTYHWSFGDGTASVTGQTVTHTFAQPASGTSGYHVCLITETNSNGIICHDTTCQFITVANTAGTIVQGYVYAGNYPLPVTNGYVVLYQANNATMGYSVFDTIALDSAGYFMYNYVNVPPTNPVFIIKAFLKPTSPLYTHYFPTFYTHTLNWYNATAVSPSANTVYYYISLIPAPTPVIGNGSIGGCVSNGSGTKAATVSGAQVFLFDVNDNPISMTLTDANGSYLFTELVLETYKVYVEILGATCTSTTVTLSNSNLVSGGNNFVVNGTTITASINETTWLLNHISEIYPNPSNGDANIDFSLLKAGKVNISVYNNLGQVVLSNENDLGAGSHKEMLNTNKLSQGIYTIQISLNNTNKIIKKFVKTR